MEEIIKGDLGYLGEDFQYRMIHFMMSDKDYFSEMGTMIDQNMFTNPNLRLIVGLIKTYFDKTNSIPTYPILQIMLNEHSSNDIEKDINESTVKKIKEIEEDGKELIEKKGIDFFKQQLVVKMCNKILSKVANGFDPIEIYEESEDLLHDTLSKINKDNRGTTVFEDMMEVMSDDYRIPIPTGVDVIDNQLEGGLGKGELGLIIGPTGFGKTSITTAFCKYASTYKCQNNENNGYKVLQIVFEDDPKKIKRKYYGNITGIEAKDLSKPEYVDEAIEMLENYKDKDMLDKNILIKQYPTGEITATKINQDIRKIINSGFKPDLVIVDYFECIEGEAYQSNINEFSVEGKTMRKLENMAKELDIALWVPSQGTKDSISAELVTMDKMGGSVKKSQISHIIMSITRGTTEDINQDKATLAILKNRSGKSGAVFENVIFNNGTCRIDTSMVNSADTVFDYNANKKKEYNNEKKVMSQDILEKLQAKIMNK